MKKIISLFVVFVLLFSVVSCAKKESNLSGAFTLKGVSEQSIQEKKSDIEKEKKRQEELAKQPKVNKIFNRYPMAIMLDNHWEARPQSGLSKAKIIYEILAEGRITRLMMLTDVKEGDVGPVRSARPYFIRAMQEYKGMYCHVGGSTEAKSTLRSDGLNDMDEFFVAGKAYRRESHRAMPHNMYAEISKLYKVAKERGYKIDLESDAAFPFDTYDRFVEIKDAKKASGISFSYTPSDWNETYQYSITYKYNKKDNNYEKFYSDTKLVDEHTNKGLKISNLIIQVAPHGIHSDGKHKVIDTVGSGKGYYITGGKYKEITWKKESKYAETEFLMDGKKIVVNPGLTFINVIEPEMEVKFE